MKGPGSDPGWVPVERAAGRLGLSHNDVLERVRDGRLFASMDSNGWFVQVVDQSVQEPSAAGDSSSVASEMRALREQMQSLQAELTAQRMQGVQAGIERSEIQRVLQETKELLATLREQVHTVILALTYQHESTAIPRDENEWVAKQVRSRWRVAREGKQGLGASLTLTGILGITAGVVLHIGLRTHALDSTVHLGYTIGLIGLFSLLIGLVLVF